MSTVSGSIAEREAPRARYRDLACRAERRLHEEVAEDDLREAFAHVLCRLILHGRRRSPPPDGTRGDDDAALGRAWSGPPPARDVLEGKPDREIVLLRGFRRWLADGDASGLAELRECLVDDVMSRVGIRARLRGAGLTREEVAHEVLAWLIDEELEDGEPRTLRRILWIDPRMPLPITLVVLARWRLKDMLRRVVRRDRFERPLEDAGSPAAAPAPDFAEALERERVLLEVERLTMDLLERHARDARSPRATRRWFMTREVLRRRLFGSDFGVEATDEQLADVVTSWEAITSERVVTRTVRNCANQGLSILRPELRRLLARERSTPRGEP